MAIALITHMDTTRPEDVTDFVTNVDFRSTPFLSATGEAVATNTLHEWLTDTYGASAHNAVIESSDASIVDHSQPTRSTNVVQMFRKVVAVSDTQIAIPHYGDDNPLTYQTKKAMTEMARDMEKALIAGTRASGSSGVARQMDGAIALITSNKTARNSGTSLTETEFNDILAGVYDGGTDESVDLVLVGTYLKRVVDRFATNVTRNLEATSLKQVLRVDVYQSSFGIHEIRLSRELPTTGVLALDTAKFKKAYLTGRRPTMVPLAKTGSATKLMIEGEVTLEARNQKSSAYRSGYFVG